MPLLERTEDLVALDDSLDGATRGRGGFVLLGGGAGVGKTALVQHFCSLHAGSTRVLSGACDPLATPRPLGPLVDMATSLAGRFQELLLSHPGDPDLFHF